MNSLSCLYYPFSRCVDAVALKQLLLVFDHVTFLDPVTDDEWRAQLFEDVSQTSSGRFEGYRELHSSLEALKGQGAIRLVDPDSIPEVSGEATALSALSDLLDPVWARLAAAPGRHALPAELSRDGKATWQIFAPKLPPRFVSALQEQADLKGHVLEQGGKDYAWTLSYEAGSAAALNVHLAAAEALSLAPVTDSTLHHALLHRKQVRARSEAPEPLPSGAFDGSLAIALLEELLPRTALNKISFEQILEFRDGTRGARRSLVDALGRKLIVQASGRGGDQEVASATVLDAIASEVREYVANMAAVKSKLFASIIPALSTRALPAGLFAVGLAQLGVGAGQVLAGSIGVAALEMLRSTLELKAERDRLGLSKAPHVTYLSRVLELEG